MFEQIVTGVLANQSIMLMIRWLTQLTSERFGFEIRYSEYLN